MNLTSSAHQSDDNHTAAKNEDQSNDHHTALTTNNDQSDDNRIASINKDNDVIEHDRTAYSRDQCIKVSKSTQVDMGTVQDYVTKSDFNGK